MENLVSTSIYEYVGTMARDGFTTLSDLFPPFALGLACVALACVLHIWLLRSAPTRDARYLDRVVLWATTASLAAIYAATTFFQDEVYIGLTQVYNLHHYGKFSLYPHTMVDGTVEFLYFFLLTPFAWSKATLVVANYCQGFLFAWLHLYFLWRALPTDRPIMKCCLLTFFTINYAIVNHLSAGFGQGAVSLVFLLAVLAQMEKRYTRGLLFACVLPLLRPDGVFYTAILFFADLLMNRRLRWRYIAFAIANIVLYYSFVHWLFGYLIPMPMVFKATSIAVAIGERLRHGLADIFIKPTIVTSLFFIVALFLRKNTCTRWLTQYFSLMLILTFAVTLYFSLHSYFNARYILQLNILLTFFLIFFLYYTPELLPRRWVGVTTRRLSVAMVTLLLAGVSLQLFGWNPGTLHVRRDGIKYAPDVYGWAGQILDRIVPEEHAIGSFFVYAVGYTNQRSIVDFAGYTNPIIAYSSEFNQKGWRINSSYFRTLMPEVFFLTSQKVPQWSAQVDFEAVLSSGGVGPEHNYLGDVRQWLPAYDIMLLRDQVRGERIESLLLVRKNAVDAVLRRMDDFAYTRTRAATFDYPRFLSLYQAPPEPSMTVVDQQGMLARINTWFD